MKTTFTLLLLLASLFGDSLELVQGAEPEHQVTAESLTLPMLNLDVNALAHGNLYPPHGGTLRVPTSRGETIVFNLGVIGPLQHTGALLFSRAVAPWIRLAPGTPLTMEVPVGFAHVENVYVLLNSTKGYCGRRMGDVTFVGRDGYSLHYPIQEGQNIRDHNKSSYCGTLTSGAGLEFGRQVRFDMQDFRMDEHLVQVSIAKIIFSAIPTPGDDSAPFIAGISVAHVGASDHLIVAPEDTRESTSLEDSLALLAKNAEDYSDYVSRAVCQENAHSEQMGFNRGPVHLTLDTKAEFSVPNMKEPYKEERVFLTKNGSPVKAGEPGITLLYKISGAFGPPLSTYFAPNHRSCLRFESSRGKISFEAVRGKAGTGVCADVAPMARGYVTLDPSTGIVDHLERTVPNDLAGKTGFAALGIIDFSPVASGTMKYQLPVRIRAERRIGQLDLKFEATYSACKLFSATSKIIYETQ